MLLNAIVDVSAAYLNAELIEPEFMKINKRLTSILRDMGEINDDLINSDSTVRQIK